MRTFYPRSILFFTLLIALAFCQSDLEAQWVRTNFPALGNPVLAIKDSFIFAGCYNPSGLVSRSTDEGATWQSCGRDLPINEDINCLTPIDSFLFAGTGGSGLFRSSDNGITWIRAYQNIPIGAIFAITRKDSFIFAGSNQGIFRALDSSLSAQRIVIGLPHPSAYGIAQIGSDIFIADSYTVIYRSSDNGDKWIMVDSIGLDVARGVSSMTMIGNCLLVSTPKAGVFRSSDAGVHWDSSNAGLTTRDVQSFLVLGNAVFAATANGAFRSIDSGRLWHPVTTGMTGNVCSLAASKTTLFAATIYNGIWRRSLSEFASENVATTANNVVTESMYLQTLAASNEVRASFYLDHYYSDMRLDLFDPLGRRVGSRTMGHASPGWNSVEYSYADLASGMYICRISGQGYAASKSLLIVR